MHQKYETWGESKRAAAEKALDIPPIPEPIPSKSFFKRVLDKFRRLLKTDLDWMN